MAKVFDIVIAGGGPAGAAAAWHAAEAGADVICLDKATFPRDKTCGDGITPRAVRLLNEMGIGDQLKKFHCAIGYRLVRGTVRWERRWPARPGFPDSGYVVPRTRFDEILLRNAESAGAAVREGVRVAGALIEDGIVRGVRTRSEFGNSEIRARVTIGADGMSSRVGQSVGLVPLHNRPCAIAIRAQVAANRPDDHYLEVYPDIQYDNRRIPGYGWLFPMGDGLANIGVGYVSTFAGWREVKINRLLDGFLRAMPAEWEIPSVVEMRRKGQLSGWRLPMGLAVWPPWRPGMMLVGDAAGVAKPYTGAGISKAIQSGREASATAVTAIDSGRIHDLSAYEERLRELWSTYYWGGRCFNRVLANQRAQSALLSIGMRSPRFMTRAFGLRREK